jgi:DNA end-binding protein Ku
MWKGVLCVGDRRVPVKLYSAIQDHDIHFRLLNAKDMAPVTQALVDPNNDKIVPYDQTQRGYAAPGGDMVVLQPDELASLEPQESRDVQLTRFVPVGAIDPQWYDRPYLLGPDESGEAYAALTAALERKNVEGVAHWVMRKKAYVGALRARDGHLLLVSLRHSGEVVPIDSLALPDGPKLDPKELAMAGQLMGMLEEDFDPTAYRDEYRDRVLGLIESKKLGKKPNLKIVRSKPRGGDLAAMLAASLKTQSNRKTKEETDAPA